MARTKPEEGTPTSVANALPPGSEGRSDWLINAINKFEASIARVDATVNGMHGQLDKIDRRLEKIEGEVGGHGKWVHTLKYVLSAAGVLALFIVANFVVPWLRSKLLSR